MWGSVSGIIKKIEKMMQAYKVNMAYADGKKIISIADDLRKIKKAQLLECLINGNLIKKRLPVEKNTPPQVQGKLWAIQTIMCALRMKRAKKNLEMKKK